MESFNRLTSIRNIHSILLWNFKWDISSTAQIKRLSTMLKLSASTSHQTTALPPTTANQSNKIKPASNVSLQINSNRSET